MFGVQVFGEHLFVYSICVHDTHSGCGCVRNANCTLSAPPAQQWGLGIKLMVFVFGFALFVCSDCLFVYSIGFRQGTAHPARRLPQSFRSGACRSSVEPCTIFLEVHIVRVLA